MQGYYFLLFGLIAGAGLLTVEIASRALLIFDVFMLTFAVFGVFGLVGSFAGLRLLMVKILSIVKTKMSR